MNDFIHTPITLDWRGKIVQRSITAAYAAHGKGCIVTVDEAGCKLAELVAVKRTQTGRTRGYRPTYGLNVNDAPACDRIGAFTELAVVCATGLAWRDFGGLSGPDVGDHIQVRGTDRRGKRLLVHPDDPDEAPVVLSITTPPTPQIYIAGWLHGREAKKTKYWTELQPGRPCYAVPERDLHPMIDLPDGLCVVWWTLKP